MRLRGTHEDNPYMEEVPSMSPYKKYQLEESTRGRISPQASFLSSILPELKHMVGQMEVMTAVSGHSSSKKRTKAHTTEEHLLKLARKLKRCEYEIMKEKEERKRLEKQIKQRSKDSRCSREIGKFKRTSSNNELPVRQAGKLLRRSQNFIEADQRKQNKQEQPKINKIDQSVDTQLQHLLSKLENTKQRLQTAQSTDIRRRLRREMIDLSQKVRMLAQQKSSTYKAMHQS